LARLLYLPAYDLQTIVLRPGRSKPGCAAWPRAFTILRLISIAPAVHREAYWLGYYRSSYYRGKLAAACNHCWPAGLLACWPAGHARVLSQQTAPLIDACETLADTL
jgi:hypothetical protein